MAIGSSNNNGTNGDDILEGTTGNDQLSGRNGSDLINGHGDGLNATRYDKQAGRNQRDVLSGGSGADYFQLGDLVMSYYTRRR